MSGPLIAGRDALARHFCEQRHDCAAEWAECDHGFGYRDADELLASGVVHDLGTLADDEALAEWVSVPVLDYDPKQGIESRYAVTRAILTALVTALTEDGAA